jgi:hypothetical protein
MDGLKLSTDKLDLAAPDRGDRTTRVIFIRFRGPQALKELTRHTRLSSQRRPRLIPYQRFERPRFPWGKRLDQY